VLAKRIIPCLDVDAGRVVKGIRFVDIRDAGDPVEMAAIYDREGADELVFLDITATHEKRDTIVDLARRTAENVFVPFTIGGGIRSAGDAQGVLDAVRRTADSVFIPLTVGGGIRTLADMEALLRAGADKVSLNTSALQDPELISKGAERFGEQCIVVAVDARREGDGWGVYTHGGRHSAGRDAVAWAREATDRGAGEILLTSMDRDGTGLGYDIELTRAVAAAVPVPVIASGGAGEPEHLREVLVEGGADAALAASIFHFESHPVPRTKEYLRQHGVPVRL